MTTTPRPMMPRIYRWLLTVSGVFFVSQSIWATPLHLVESGRTWLVLIGLAGMYLIVQAWSHSTRQVRLIGASAVILLSVWRMAAFLQAGIAETLEWDRIAAAAPGWLVIGAFCGLLAGFGWVKDPPNGDA